MYVCVYIYCVRLTQTRISSTRACAVVNAWPSRSRVWWGRARLGHAPWPLRDGFMLTPGGTFDHWTTISADVGPVVEGPSWLSTHQEFDPPGSQQSKSSNPMGGASS